MAFKTWDEFHQAFRKTLDENNIQGSVVGGCEEPWIFFVYDRNQYDVLWTFCRDGVLKRYQESKKPFTLETHLKR